jgi:hypothetical protein
VAVPPHQTWLGPVKEILYSFLGTIPDAHGGSATRLNAGKRTIEYLQQNPQGQHTAG